jgi:hypothetical protein
MHWLGWQRNRGHDGGQGFDRIGTPGSWSEAKMTEAETAKPKGASVGKAGVDRLFVLDVSGCRVVSMNPDGSDKKIIVSNCRYPDGIAVDVEAGHIYWTNMGVPDLNDGSIERADIDGKNRKFIVPEGSTFTPKQLHLDKTNGKLYWSDREGMRVMRSNLDGSYIQTLVVGSTVTPHIGRDGVESGCRQRRELVTPRVPALRKAVAQDEERPFPLFGKVEVDAVRLDHAMRDSAAALPVDLVELKDGITRGRSEPRHEFAPLHLCSPRSFRRT